MLKMQYFPFLLIPFSILLKVSAETDFEIKKTEQFLLYNQYGEQLDPSKTFEILSQLKDIHAKYPEKWPVEEIERTNDLIEATEISEKNCDLDELTNAERRFEVFHEYKQSLVPFLKFYLHKQFALCKSVLEDKLRERIGSLPEKTKHSMISIRESIEGSEPDLQKSAQHLFRPSQAFKDGVLSVIERHSSVHLSEFNEGEEGEYLFELDFNNLILNPCREASSRVKEPMVSIDIFTNHVNVWNEISPSSLYWVENINICRNIISHRKALIEDTYERLENKLKSEQVVYHQEPNFQKADRQKKKSLLDFLVKKLRFNRNKPY